MNHVVIISPDRLFCETLSDIVSRELGVDVTSLDAEKSLPAGAPASLIVTTEKLQKTHDCRIVIMQPGAPRAIARVLSDINRLLSQKNQGMQPLAPAISLDPRSRMLAHDGGAGVELTEKEQALLLYIKENGEAAREDILQQVWGFAPDVTTHTLETHLYRLRQKWREIADYDCIIATDRGYRWA